MGKKKVFFLSREGEKRRLAKETYSYRIGEGQFLPIQSIWGQ